MWELGKNSALSKMIGMSFMACREYDALDYSLMEGVVIQTPSFMTDPYLHIQP